MLPLTDGIEKTKIYIFIYSLLMIPVIIFPYAIGFSNLVYLIPALILTLYYNVICYDLYKYKKNRFNLKKAKKVFAYSILYLFLIFVLFLIDNLIQILRLKKIPLEYFKIIDEIYKHKK